MRIDEINGAGMLAAPVLLWTLGEPEHNPEGLPEEQAVKLARYIAARYQANHVVGSWRRRELLRRKRRALAQDCREVFGGPRTRRSRFIPWPSVVLGDFAQEEWLDLIHLPEQSRRRPQDPLLAAVPGRRRRHGATNPCDP